MIKNNKFFNISKTVVKKTGSFLKKNLLGIIIGAVIVGGISIVTADYSFYSSSVYYDNSSSISSSSNVSGALNDLYSRIQYGNASSSQILSGKTALVNGQKVSGSMIDRGAITGTVSAGNKYYIPAGYHNGSGYIQGTGVTLSGSKTITKNGTYSVSSLGYPSTLYVDVPAEIVKVKDLPYNIFSSQYIGAYNTYYVTTVTPAANKDVTITYPNWTGGALYSLTGSKKNHGSSGDPYYQGDPDDGESGSTTEKSFEVVFSSAYDSPNLLYEDEKTSSKFPRMNANSLYRAKAVNIVLSCYSNATTFLKSWQGEEYFYGVAGTGNPEDIVITILKEPNSYKIKSTISNYDGEYTAYRNTASNGTISYKELGYSNYWISYIENSNGNVTLTLDYYAMNYVATTSRGYCKAYKTGTDYEPPESCYNSIDTIGLYDYYGNDKQDEAYSNAYTSNTFTTAKNVIKAPNGYKYIYALFQYKD